MTLNLGYIAIQEMMMDSRLKLKLNTLLGTEIIDLEIPQTDLKSHTTLLLTRNVTCKEGLYLVILVTSHAWTGSKRRSTIRDTWGPYRPKTSRKSWQTFFVIGNKVNTSSNITKPTEIEALRNEVARYGDIIEGDFEEKFNHLPRKLQVAFEWASLYCKASFIHKTDDDVYVNTKNALNFLGGMKRRNLYTGYVWTKPPVIRWGKYKVEYTAYNKTHYPDFVAGSSMFYSPDVIQRLVGIFPKEPLFRLDDVYIGILVDKLKIKATKIDIPGKKTYWMVWLPWESENQCQPYPQAIVRHIHGNKQRWCMNKLFRASASASSSASNASVLA